MRFFSKSRDSLLVLGLCWLLFLCLISAFPVKTLPNQVDQDLATKRHLLSRAAPELEGWKIYQEYRKRVDASKKKSPKLSASENDLIAQTIKAKRQPDPNHRGLDRYIFGKESVTVKDKILGGGTGGTVYEGILNPDEEPVAVKESKRPNLLRAGAFMVTLKDSKNVIEQLGIFKGESLAPNKKGKYQDMYFQITPLMDETLSAWLERIGPDDWEMHQKPIAEKALGGLVSMHLKGIAHRDYKSSNILLKKENEEIQVLIADLDAATDEAVSSQVRTGTKGYTPLEYMIGPEFDTKLGDVFAAAMTMLELLFRYRVTVKPPSLGWRETLWMAILDAQTQRSKWPNFKRETSAARIKRNVLLNDSFADLLPGMTNDIAEVLSRAFCLQEERDTSEEFMKSFLPLLPFKPAVKHDGC